MNLDFPLVYRLRRGWRITFAGLGAILAIGAVIGLIFVPAKSEFFVGQLFLAVVWLGLALLGAYLVLGVLRTRVVLRADLIEVHGAFSKRSLWRPDIAGRRLLPIGSGPPVIELMPRIMSASTALKLPQYLATDSAFDDWLASIPDVDAEQAQASLDAMLEDPGLGGSREEKLAALAQARRTAKILLTATFVVCAWVWFYPHPYDLAIVCAAVIPWIAVVVASREGALYRLNPSRNDAGADLSAPVLLPGFALVVRALLDFRQFDWERLLMMTVVVAAVCVLLMVWLVRELRSGVLITGVLMFAYAYGVVVLANSRLDGGEPAVYPAQVLGAHVSSGKSTSYYLELGPWGPRATAESVDVGKDYYPRASRQETVCVYLYEGALRARWFEVWDCPRR